MLNEAIIMVNRDIEISVGEIYPLSNQLCK